jgi:hypothetical protein
MQLNLRLLRLADSAVTITINAKAAITPAATTIAKTIGRSIDHIETLSVSCWASAVKLVSFVIVPKLAIRVMNVHRIFFMLMFHTLTVLGCTCK